MGEIPLGVYGLRIIGLPPGVARAFAPVSDDAPEIVVDIRLASSIATRDHCDDSHLVLATARGTRYEIRRDPATAILSLPAVPPEEAVAHPLLTIVASTHNRWLGRLTLHGGAVVIGGRAWAVLAEKEGGKSTTLAGLAGRGLPVLTDDLVVVDGGDVLAGPRSIDLRPDAALHLGLGEEIGGAGRRDRHRVILGQPPARVPLGGFVTLTWSDHGEVRVRSLSTDERLRCLFRHEALPMMGAQPASVLFPALGFPMYELGRPRSWDVHEQVLEVLTGLARASSPAPERAMPAGGGRASARSAADDPTPP